MLSAWFSNVPAECSPTQVHIVTTLHDAERRTTGGPGLSFTADRAAEALRAAASMNSSADSFRPVLDLALATGNWHAASVSMLVDACPRTPVGPVDGATVATTADEADRLDRRQFALGEGPGLAAIRTGGPVTVDDVAADFRWPTWCRYAADVGVIGAMSAPLFTDSTIGVLNLYRFAASAPAVFAVARDMSTFGPVSPGIEAASAEPVCLEVLAAHASVLLAHFAAMQNLRRAMEARNVIGQAQGMLMERYRLSPSRAFAVLRRYSNQTNRKVSVVAEQLISTGHLPELPSGLATGAGGQ